MITHFVMMGERCSGTNFFESTIQTNLNLTRHPHPLLMKKHFFLSWKKLLQSDIETSHILFCGIVRSPYTWLASFHDNPHHVTKKHKKNWESFLTLPWNSVYSKHKMKLYNSPQREILEDRDLNGNRFENIFKMRNGKNNFLLNEMPKLVEHFILLKYEDLRDNYSETVIKISQKFNIPLVHSIPKTIDNYKKTNRKYVPKTYIFPKNVRKLIDKNLDRELELKMGYHIK